MAGASQHLPGHLGRGGDTARRGASLCESLEPELIERITSAARERLYDTLRERIQYAVRERLRESLQAAAQEHGTDPNRVVNAVRDRLAEAIEQRVAEGLKERLREAVRDPIEDVVRHRVTDALRSQAAERLAHRRPADAELSGEGLLSQPRSDRDLARQHPGVDLLRELVDEGARGGATALAHLVLPAGNTVTHGRAKTVDGLGRRERSYPEDTGATEDDDPAAVCSRPGAAVFPAGAT